jgi:hypothetical protein
MDWKKLFGSENNDLFRSLLGTFLQLWASWLFRWIFVSLRLSEIPFLLFRYGVLASAAV